MRVFAILLLVIVIITTARPVLADEPCLAGEVTINWRILQGQIVLYDGGRRRPATGAVVDLFVWHENSWQHYTKVIPANSGARFALMEVDPGKYLVVASYKDFRPTRVYVNVKRGRSEKEVVIPVSNTTCGHARLTWAR